MGESRPLRMKMSAQPDIPFHIFGAFKSVDQRLCPTQNVLDRQILFEILKLY